MVKLLLRKAALTFLPLGIAITLMCLLIYGVAQQVYRTTSNDPQIEVAHIVAAKLDEGVKPEDMIVGQPVDMASNLSIHISVFDKSGNMLASTARLNDKAPTPPKGIFEVAETKGEDVFTWQPEKGVRCAAVAVPYKNGIVLVGKSLRLEGERQQSLALMVFAVWLITMIITAVTTALVIYWQWNAMFYPQ